jgi:four helix bundle protein
VPGVSRTLANQLLRSGTSIGANVEEGQGSQSRADFIAKYSIACKEARETNYWLRLLVASEIATDLKLQELIDESNQLIAILTSIIKATRKNA